MDKNVINENETIKYKETLDQISNLLNCSVELGKSLVE